MARALSYESGAAETQRVGIALDHPDSGTPRWTAKNWPAVDGRNGPARKRSQARVFWRGRWGLRNSSFRVTGPHRRQRADGLYRCANPARRSSVSMRAGVKIGSLMSGRPAKASGTALAIAAAGGPPARARDEHVLRTDGALGSEPAARLPCAVGPDRSPSRHGASAARPALATCSSW
jgi:hypothetical protein